jgi:hypothetical protein
LASFFQIPYDGAHTGLASFFQSRSLNIELASLRNIAVFANLVPQKTLFLRLLIQPPILNNPLSRYCSATQFGIAPHFSQGPSI